MLISEFYYPGQVGVLLALIFLANELVLIPLFEVSRERLTVAHVRARLAAGEPVSLKRTRSLWLTLGLSDGVRVPLESLLLPRFLKVFFRLALLFSYFFFELQVDQRLVAYPRPFHFPTRGPRNLSRLSSAVATIPVEGIPARALRGLVPVYSLRADAESNYSVARTPAFSFDYSAWCTATERSPAGVRRRLFFGVYTAAGPSRLDSLACMNGSEGRDTEELLSYNTDSTRAAVGKASAVTLTREVARDRLSRMYEASVSVADGPLRGTHDGFMVITYHSYFMKDVWISMYGLVLIHARGTIARVHVPLTISQVPCCTREDYNECLRTPDWVGTWTFRGRNTTCPNGLSYSTEQVAAPAADVQDIDLRLGASTRFRVGAPRDVMRAWLAETPFYAFQAPMQFTRDVEEKMTGDTFYFSSAREPNITLRTGVRTSVTMNAKATVALIAVLAGFVLYCAVAFALEWRSRRATGISSDCLSREAVITMLLEDSVRRGRIDSNETRFVPLRTTQLVNGDWGVGVGSARKDFGYTNDGEVDFQT